MAWPGQLRDTRLREKYERIRAGLERFQQENRPDASALPREVREVLGYIHDHLFDPALNVAMARAGCGLRDNNVSTRFRKAVGLGIREYIEALRMQAAGRLLEDAGLEIYLVAMAVGYDHQETFCRAFQRQFGDSPSQARENVKRSDQETGSISPHRSSAI